MYGPSQLHYSFIVQRKRLLGRELQDYGAQLESHRENENALMKKESPAR